MLIQSLSGKQQRRYLKRWVRLGPILDAIRHDEIRRMNNEEYLRTMEQLWSVVVNPTKRDTSGLVEWQRLLRQ